MKKTIVTFTIILVVIIFILNQSRILSTEEKFMDFENVTQQEIIINLNKDWNNTWKNVIANEGELSEKQIERINALLTPSFTSNDLTEVNPLSCFLTSYYDTPNKMDLDEFLRYFPYDEETEELQELDDLKSHINWPFGDITNIDSIPVPIHRYNGELIRSFVTSYMNVEQSTLLELDETIYLETTDAYYNYTSDFGVATFVCVDGFVMDNEIQLNGESSILTIMYLDGKYLIESYNLK